MIKRILFLPLILSLSLLVYFTAAADEPTLGPGVCIKQISIVSPGRIMMYLYNPPCDERPDTLGVWEIFPPDSIPYCTLQIIVNQDSVPRILTHEQHSECEIPPRT